MNIDVRSSLRELSRVTVLAGLVWLAVVMVTLFGASPDSLVAGAVGGLLGGVLGAAMTGGRYHGLRWQFGMKVVVTIGALLVGAVTLVFGPTASAWVSLGTLAIGVWLALDVLVAYRLTQETVPSTNRVLTLSFLQTVRIAASEAENPLTVPELAERCDASEDHVRVAVAVLLARGTLESRDGGYVANNDYLGRSFSPAGFVRRLTRPVRLFDQSRHA